MNKFIMTSLDVEDYNFAPGDKVRWTGGETEYTYDVNNSHLDIYHSPSNNDAIFRALGIDEPNSRCEKILGTPCNGDWPMANTLKDLNKIIHAVNVMAMGQGRTMEIESLEPGSFCFKDKVNMVTDTFTMDGDKSTLDEFDVYGARGLCGREWLARLPDGYRELMAEEIETHYGNSETVLATNYFSMANFIVDVFARPEPYSSFFGKLQDHYDNPKRNDMPPLPEVDGSPVEEEKKLISNSTSNPRILFDSSGGGSIDVSDISPTSVKLSRVAEDDNPIKGDFSAFMNQNNLSDCLNLD